MNRIIRRITLAVLIIGGIVCISLAIALPPLSAILGAVGSVMLGGAFGMFQAVITPTPDNEAHNPGHDDAQQAHIQNINIDHNLINPQINMLFLYDLTPEQLDDPIHIERPHRPLNLV